MIHLYMDEDVQGAIIAGLRQRGIDLITALEDGHNATADSLVMERAGTLGCVLFSQDEDMLAIAHRRHEAGIPFCGVIYAKQNRIKIGLCVNDLELIAVYEDPEAYANRVEYLPL